MALSIDLDSSEFKFNLICFLPALYIIDIVTIAADTSIDRSKICDLASTFHPERKPCRIFCEPKKGSYNICFPIVFLSDEGDTDEK